MWEWKPSRLQDLNTLFTIETFFSAIGGPNLQLRTNVSFAGTEWKESLLDPESAECISETDTLLNEVREVVFRVYSEP